MDRKLLDRLRLKTRFCPYEHNLGHSVEHPLNARAKCEPHIVSQPRWGLHHRKSSVLYPDIIPGEKGRCSKVNARLLMASRHRSPRGGGKPRAHLMYLLPPLPPPTAWLPKPTVDRLVHPFLPLHDPRLPYGAHS